MGLPIFFKPSEPDSSSNSTEDPTSRARSTIRGHAPILRSTLRNPSSRATNRPRVHSARRRAPTDDVEQHRFYYSSDPYRSVLIAAPSRSSITTTTSDAMGHARRNDSSSPEIPIITFRPSAFTDFINANDNYDDEEDEDEDEDDGPPMPAVPESRDFSNPSNIESRDSSRRHQRSIDTPLFGAHGIPLASLLSQTSSIPEQRSGVVSPTRIDARDTNRNNALAERLGETNSQDFLAQRHQVRRRDIAADRDRRIQRRMRGERRSLDATLRQELVQHPRHHDAVEYRQRFYSHEARRISDFREQLRIRERIRASRERMQDNRESTPARTEGLLQGLREIVDRSARPRSEDQLLAEVERPGIQREGPLADEAQLTWYAHSGRGEQQTNTPHSEIEQTDPSITSSSIERQRFASFERMPNHLDVEGNGLEATQSNTSPQSVEGGTFRINTNYDGLGDRERSIEFQEPERGHGEFDDHYFIDNVEQLNVNDRSDLRHDLDLEGQESWDSIVITPDPQSPNPSSSFASTAASSSQRPSLGTSVSSVPENESLTIGNCDNQSDVTSDDEALVAAMENFERYTQNRPGPAYAEQPIGQHRAFAG
ncbi:uncharacterized protein EAF01_005441 [Botrytis porri]|uniref:Uncharacterized protein n=1 Tax=Botrytis porri TaxID=87229 RepID=A0A4Z1KH70_9HELO|nr:uncharacterized protein EAF01_005441 [Botrytis porri]KAF7904919.1 hypothetical protein EAF01_005441 [Botrytis porri]TGO84880.1 hypothetical protein BPOR_0455g00060 [Botrytis porri]